jgi:Tol biopolymer transport system component
MPLAAGTRLGPYEILSAIGAGGMGEVYKARDTRLDRTVALKLIAPLVADDALFRSRFEREARMASALDHPNVCPIYDVGLDSSGPFLVMPFIEGETLAARLTGKRLPIADALNVGVQIAAALEAAHDRGIVHRDLKPLNVVVTATGTAKVLDFGLAKAIAPADESAGGATSVTGSSPGMALGTLAYMSPEQARGQAVDTRTDIWAFGCVLFEMLAGRPAFTGATSADVVAAIVSAEPDWQALHPDTPAAATRLLKRCLRKDQGRRLRHAGDARIELEDALGEPAASGGSVSRRSAASTWLPWALAAVAAATALGMWLASQRPAPVEQMRFSALTSFPGVEGGPTFSPDGRSVAFVSNRDGDWDIYVGLVAGGSFVRVTHDAVIEQGVRWSPDGGHLLFARMNERGGTDLCIVPALGGAARRIVLDASDPAWSPDGRSIAYSSRGVIWTADTAGGNPRQLTQIEPPVTHRQPSFSHSGREMAYVRRRGGPYGGITILDLHDGRARTLWDDRFLTLSPVWSADDRFLYFSSSRGGAVNIWKAPVNGGNPEQITAGVGEDAELDLSSDGQRLVYSTYHANVDLSIVPVDGSSTSTQWLTNDSVRSELAPRYSPDGSQIAYFSSRSGSEGEGLWVINADGSNLTPLVVDRRRNVFPSWTRDGSAIVFLTSSSGVAWTDAELRRVALGGGSVQSLSAKPWATPWGDVGPDDRLLIRTSATTGAIVDPRTHTSVDVPNFGADASAGSPLWSPDGGRFAFVMKPDAARPADDGVWVASTDGARQHPFSGWVVWFAWISKNELLVLEGKPTLRGRLWRVSLEGARTLARDDIPLRVPYSLGLTPTTRFDVSRDGRHVVIEALRMFESNLTIIENVR